MNYQDKHKVELIKELKKLHQEFDSLKISFEKDITERKQAEVALRESEERYSRLIEGSPDAIAVHSKGKFVFVNEAGMKLLGVQSPQELIGKPILSVVHPDSRREVIDRLRQVAKGKEAPLSEEKFVKFDGSVIDVEVVGIPCLYQGQVATQVIVREITGRKRLEEILKKEKQELRLITDSSPIIIFYKDKEGRFVRVNKTFAEAINIPEEEFVGKTVFDLYSDKIAQSMTNDDQEVFTSGRPKLNIIEQYDSSSGIKWAQTDKIPIYDENGIPFGLIGFAQDITERKRAEEALRESEERFRQLYQQAPLGYQSLDAEGCFIDVNQAWLDLFQYPRDEVIGRWFGDFLAPQEVAAFRQRFQCFKATGEVHVDVEMVQRTGSRIIVHIDGKTGQDEHGQFKQTHCILHDITGRKRMESSLRQALEWKEAIFEGSRDAVFISDQDSCFVAVNNAASYLTGYSREQLLKMRIPDIHDLSDLEAYKMYHQRIFGGEEILSEAKILQSNGTKTDTEFSNRCVSIAGKQYMHTTARNITERKQADETLKNLLSLTEATLESIYNGILVISLRRSVIKTNARFAEMWRIPEDIFKSGDDKILLDYVLGQLADPDAFIAKVEELYENPEAESFDLIYFKDGRIFERISRPMYLGGEPKARVWSFFDITERKRAEEALHLEKENFRHSLDDSPLGVRIVTMEGETIYANQAIINIYGYDSLEVLQKTHLKDRYTPESYHQAQKRKVQRKRGDLSATDYEISIVRKNGEIRHLQVYRKEVLWNGVKQFQVIYKDITERKKAEEEVIRSKKLLEDLHKHLNEIRENERASISREIHDQIGQSLTALKLDLNRMHKYIDTNPEAVTKLESMIELVSDTIKDVQRISSDLRPGILDELGLVSAIEWYCDEFEKRTGIRYNLKLDDSDYSNSQINLTFFRVLQETLTNVIRHAKASSVSIKLRQLIKGVTMTIQDNGIGIPEEKIRSTKSLGLISMRERVKQFNGTIDISSKKESGTKLVIFIPS